MQKRFNYLQDESAVREILKHKWLESQKKGQDIGFVTAALDWITKYGEGWQKHHNKNLPSDKINSPLVERRQYRRFKINLPVKIRTQNLEFSAQIKELNHIGVDFFSEVPLATASPIEIVISGKREKGISFNINLKAKVAKVLSCGSLAAQGKKYLIFTTFEQNAQQVILENQNWLFN
jgi:hypothetical protein